MDLISSCSELLASFIAMELDLNVAEPAIIEISPEFLETLRGSDAYKNASGSEGINFGCKYKTGYIELVSNQQISDQLTECAADIFTFDVFIANPDRRIHKPNVSTNGEDFLIFDHELAFGFIFDVLQAVREPWKISEKDMTWIKQHYFFNYLKGNGPDFSKFVEKFSSLDASFWRQARTLIPNEWITDRLDRIETRLCSFVDHRQEFKDELNRILL